MTELDFDELDKAVNSLMSDKEPTQAPVPDVSAALETTPSPSVSVDPTPALAGVPSPAVRRRGQFMDMIHPSSNMRSAPVPVRQQAADIMPMTPPSDTSTELTPEPVSEWPDPIDMVVPPVSESPSEQPAPDLTPLSVQPAIVPEDLSSSLIEDPQTSPFLPDTKVEKRPLGSPLPQADFSSFEAPFEQVPESDAAIELETTPVEAEQPVETEVAEAVSLPDELKDEVIAVETNEVLHEEAPLEVAAPEVSVTPAVVPDTAQSTATGAIVPQYQEQPSTGDQTNGPIYDTNTYHQPLDAQPHKKKSAVLAWILWTLVLLIVGATAGAAWFYFTTQ